MGEHAAIGLTLDSAGETKDFYNLYSRKHGFGIRYGKSRLNVEKTKCMQEVVYGCSASVLQKSEVVTQFPVGACGVLPLNDVVPVRNAGEANIRKQQVLPVRVPSHDLIALRS